MRFVVFGDRIEVVRTRASKFLLGLDVLQHRADSKLLSLSSQPQGLGGSGKILFRRGELVEQRLRASVAFNDLTNDFVAQLLSAQPGGFQPCFAGMNAAGIEQTTGANSPAKPDEVILRFAEIACAVIFPAAKSADKCLRAE